MLGCYRRDDFPEPEVFAGHVRRVLSRYPLWVVEEAACRMPEEFKFVPSIAEIRGTCEAIYAPYLASISARRVGTLSSPNDCTPAAKNSDPRRI